MGGRGQDVQSRSTHTDGQHEHVRWTYVKTQQLEETDPERKQQQQVEAYHHLHNYSEFWGRKGRVLASSRHEAASEQKSHSAQHDSQLNFISLWLCETGAYR